jgi:hypothetical protein
MRNLKTVVVIATLMIAGSANAACVVDPSINEPICGCESRMTVARQGLPRAHFFVLYTYFTDQ